MPAEGEMQAPHSELPAITADILDRVRARRPRMHCITNAVAQAFTANMLLAAGAVPSMTIAQKEVRAFAAIGVANKAGIPWVLDPVFIDRSPPRAAFARALVKKKPRALRLNAAELAALTGGKIDDAALARTAMTRVAAVVLTGEQDLIHDGKRLATLANGHPLMSRVTAMGCAASALVGAALAVEPDAWKATAAALILVGVAGEVAAERARGPGSFAVEILDAISALDRDTLMAKAKVS
jgi:hydroxyethylthiazole kinase